MTEGNGEVLRTANPHADYLRALGHADAAAALEAAAELVPKSGPDAGRDAPVPEPQRQSDPEAQRRAEGEVLLAAMRRDIPTLFEDR